MTEIKFEERKTIEQVEESTELAPKFDKDGLIPVVTTDFSSGEVLMQGYMNEEALKKQSVWVKRFIIHGVDKHYGTKVRLVGLFKQ